MKTMPVVKERFTQALIAYLKKTPWRSLWNPELSVYAAALAYTTMLSFIPLLAVIFALVNGLGLVEMGLSRLEPYLFRTLAPGSGEIVIDHIQHFLIKARPATVGTLGMFGFAVASYSMLLQVNRAVNTVVGASIKSTILDQTYKIFALFLITPFIMSVSLALSALLPIRGSIIAFALDAFFFGIVYKILINKKLKPRAITAGALVTAIAWELAKMAYSIYTRKAILYSAIYGPLSAIPLFFLWIYLAWTVFLLGASATVAFDGRINPNLKKGVKGHDCDI
jgi:membrane protein